LEPPLAPREVRDLPNVTVSDRHIGVAVEQGSYEARDVASVELPVSVDRDNNVGASMEGCLHPRLEGRGQAAMSPEPHDTVCATGGGNAGGFVTRAIVDHQPHDLIKPGHAAGQPGQSCRQLPGLLIARDLDHQLHPGGSQTPLKRLGQPVRYPGNRVETVSIPLPAGSYVIHGKGSAVMGGTQYPLTSPAYFR
jgi:hypothetical protein